MKNNWLYSLLFSSALPFFLLLIYFSLSSHSFRLGFNPEGTDSLLIFLPDSLILFAQDLRGIGYRYGGIDEGGFDCSGFTRFVYRRHDIDLPRSSREQFHVGTNVERQQIRKADLLFFKGRNPHSKTIGHVGLAISDWSGSDVYFVHAAVKGGVRIDSLSNPYYGNRYMGAKRIVAEDGNFFLLPQKH
jgi:cell wall-associated NlpC family hydrolase